MKKVIHKQNDAMKAQNPWIRTPIRGQQKPLYTYVWGDQSTFGRLSLQGPPGAQARAIPHCSQALSLQSFIP